MLVLSRKARERIVITGPCILTLVDVRGDKARLGLEGPADTAFWREELLEKPEYADQRQLLESLTGSVTRPRAMPAA